MNIDEDYDLLPLKWQRPNQQAAQEAVDILMTHKGRSDVFYAAMVHDKYLAGQVSDVVGECANVK